MSGGPRGRDWSSGLTPLVVFALLTAMFAGLGPALDTRMVQLGERSFVYLIEEGRAVRREVALGQRTDEVAEVLAGLKPGEQVVVRGVGNLREGVAVSLLKETGGAPTGGS